MTLLVEGEKVEGECSSEGQVEGEVVLRHRGQAMLPHLRKFSAHQ
jgi:hypothetical protein